MQIENMNTTMKILYELREFLPDNLKNSGTIIRFDLDHQTPPDNIKLVVITRGRFYNFFIDDSDFDDLGKLYNSIINHITNDFNNGADIPRG